jgi:hypothetical protein
MLFGGSDAPCANAYLMSIGKLGVEENKKEGTTSHFNQQVYLYKIIQFLLGYYMVRHFLIPSLGAVLMNTGTVPVVSVVKGLKQASQCKKAARTAQVVLSHKYRAFHYRDRHIYL